METTTLDKLPLGQEAIIARSAAKAAFCVAVCLIWGSRPAPALWYASAHRSVTRWKSPCVAMS